MTKNHDMAISHFCKSDRANFESGIKVFVTADFRSSEYGSYSMNQAVLMHMCMYLSMVFILVATLDSIIFK